MPVGYFDPDDDGTNSSVKAQPEPKTQLQRLVLEACGKKFFNGPKERKQFRQLEDMCRGSTPEEIMIEEWFKHCCLVWKKANTPIPTRPYTHLIKFMMNSQKRQEWILLNRARILKERSTTAAAAINDAYADSLRRKNEKK